MRNKWKCCGCGVVSVERERRCYCATDCLFDDFKIAVKTPNPLYPVVPSLLEAAEALIEKIAHVNGIESERAALIAACVKAHGGGK